MKEWLDAVARLAMAQSPAITAEHAGEIAQDLFNAWPENTPEEAVAWFFALPLESFGEPQLVPASLAA